MSELSVFLSLVLPLQLTVLSLYRCRQRLRHRRGHVDYLWVAIDSVVFALGALWLSTSFGTLWEAGSLGATREQATLTVGTVVFLVLMLALYCGEIIAVLFWVARKVRAIPQVLRKGKK